MRSSSIVSTSLSVLALSFASVAAAQWGWGSRHPPKYPEPGDLTQSLFTFCRIEYDSVRREELGHGWNTDYPNSDINFSVRLGQLTHVRINQRSNGEPNHVVIRLTDDELFSCPFVFMSDVGTVGFSAPERERLQTYLLSGGFLYVDDFWGDRAWDEWAAEIGRVLSPAEYPIFDIPLDHPVFHGLYEITEVPQVPSIQHWNWTGGFSTSERGAESDEPHMRGIQDDAGRLLVVMTHNTDIADGWEREGESEEFFARFSVTKSYPLGINLILSAMSH